MGEFSCFSGWFITQCFILTTVVLTCIMLPVTGVKILLSVFPFLYKINQVFLG